MDTEKLKRLRARYADRGAFDGDDPVLLRAARDVQTGDVQTLEARRVRQSEERGHPGVGQ